MDQDYYAILGVTASADPAALRAAYLQRARNCHPDRGGSHAQMILLNEAWEVLSSPESRKLYDAHRAGTTGTQDDEIYEQEVAAARRKADDYPRDWSAFEKCFNHLAHDFTGAKFHATKGLSVVWPSASESISGWCFIVVGGVAGLFVGGGLIMTVADYFFPNGDASRMPQRLKLGLLLISICGGSWIGAAIHQLIGMLLRARAEGAAAQAAEDPAAAIRRVLSCERCGQNLRVPAVAEELTITCAKCGHRFSSHPPYVAPATPREMFTIDRATTSTLMALNLMFATAVTNILLPEWFGASAHFLLWMVAGAAVGAVAGLVSAQSLASNLITLKIRETTGEEDQARLRRFRQVFAQSVSAIGAKIGAIAGAIFIPFTESWWMLVKYPLAIIVGAVAGYLIFPRIQEEAERQLALQQESATGPR